MNGFRVHLTRLAGGFSTTVTMGDKPDVTVPVHVLDGLTFSWGYTDEYAPNTLEPSTLSFGLVARTASDLPPLNVGDLWEYRLDLVDVTDGVVTVLAPDALVYVGRLGEPEAELIPQHSWPVRIRLVLVDLLADLRSRFPRPGYFRENYLAGYSYARDWLVVWAEEKAKINLWFPKLLNEENQIGYQLYGEQIPDESAFNQLARICATWPTNAGDLSTIRWRYSLEAPDPAVYSKAGYRDYPNLSNPVGYLLQYVDRRLPDWSHLPYVLTGPTGVVRPTLDTDPADANGIAILSAGHVLIPTNARRSRDQQPNTVVINGKQRLKSIDTGGNYIREWQDSTMTITNDAEAPRSRSVDTTMWLRDINLPTDDTPPVVNEGLIRDRLSTAYRPDDAALIDEWVYDRLTVVAAAMTADEFAAIAPMLVSNAPEQGDGVAQRQVLIFDVDPAVDLSGRGRIAGRLVAGTVDLLGGDLTYDLQLAPGVLEPGASAITAAQLAAGPYAASIPAAFGTTTALDMRLVRP